MKADRDDDEDLGDEWVLSKWVVNYGVCLMAVRERDGKPSLKGGVAADVRDWFRWKSYHSARKYQRSHSHLSGYTVRNLTVLLRDAEEARPTINELGLW